MNFHFTADQQQQLRIREERTWQTCRSRKDEPVRLGIDGDALWRRCLGSQRHVSRTDWKAPKRRCQAPSAQSGSLHLVTEAERLLSQAWEPVRRRRRRRRRCWGCTKDGWDLKENTIAKRFYSAKKLVSNPLLRYSQRSYFMTRFI